jgi:hypothetical protein
MPAYWLSHNVHYILPLMIYSVHTRLSFVAQHPWGNKTGVRENIIEYSKYFPMVTLDFSLAMHEQKSEFVEGFIFNFFEHMRTICISST